MSEGRRDDGRRRGREGDPREARLSAALKANMGRRKAQARARVAEARAAEERGATDPEEGA